MSELKVGILGASGYGGAELLRRLLSHPHVTVSGVASRQFLGQSISACWPQLAGQSDLIFEDTDAVIAGCDVLFCATPHAETAPLVKRALDAGKRVIDLSADFRLSPEDYARWYGPHSHPKLCDKAVYGLVELHREELAGVKPGGAELVAVPGCNSTTANLALAPLAANGLLGRDIIVNVLAGVSGAGRSTALGLHYPEVNENAKPYKVAGTHRHTAEIEDTLGRVQTYGRQLKTHGDFAKPTVSFTPHLIPMTRGILATCTTRPEQTGLDDKGLLELYQTFYQGEKLVTVQAELPQTKAVYGSDRTLVSVRFDKRTGLISAFAVTDNLGKGAAGQAVQAFNVVNGFDEATGLFLQGVWP